MVATLEKKMFHCGEAQGLVQQGGEHGTMETGMVLEKEPKVLRLTGNRKFTACHTEQSLRKRAQSRPHSDTLPPDGMVCPPASRSGLKKGTSYPVSSNKNTIPSTSHIS